MNYRRFLLASVLLLTTFFSASAQLVDSVDLNTLVAKAVKYTNDYPIEKVYVHFDKPYYTVGDTIWLKAYVTVDEHVPSTMSKIVYVDMYNDQDSLMAAIKLPVANGIAVGQIALPVDNYKQGNYRLRGYTNWMLNFDPAYLFNKIITVGNPFNNDVLTNISFSTSKGAQPTISTRIQYKGPDGKPYVNSKVSWTIESGHEDVAKGKGSTDQDGYLNISLPPIPSITLSSAVLITTIDIPDKKKDVTRTFSLKQAAPGKDVQFFPEGGSFIAGVPSKIAVKAIQSDGLGIDVKGSIVDNTGTEVTKFESQHLGMGVFNLQPEAGKSYKANVSFSDGTQMSYNLPRVQPSGMVLSVDNSNPDSLAVKMTVSDAYLTANQGKRFYLIAQSGGFIKYAAQTALQKKVYLAILPKTKFPTGILQISLLTVAGSPMSERLVFNQSNDLMNLGMNTDKPLYGRRQPVKMNITAKNGATPAFANLSVSVIDENKIPVDEDAESTILSSLLLTSDLKGYIEKPNYYFKNKDPKTLADLDILMLTQGYRRFAYRDIVNEKKPVVTLMPEQGINVSGTLRNTTGMPIFKGNVRLLMADRNTALDAVTNADGVFNFQNVMVNDSVKVTVNARNNVNSNNIIMSVDGSKYPAPTRITALPDEKLNIDSAMRPYMDNSKIEYSNNNHQFKEVLIKSTFTPKRLGHLDQPALSGLGLDPDHVIDGDRFKGCTNFVSCLQSMAMGLLFTADQFFVQRDYNQGNKYPVAVFIDGLKVDNAMLQTINAADVESVEIFFKDGLTGINQMDQTNGVLVINKKKAPKGTTLSDLQKLIPPPYIMEFNPKGYAVIREFYSPKYEVNKPSSALPDLRTTIYWNPKVITDKTTGTASLQFSTSDGIGSYRAVVEGMDQNGHVGRYVYRYKVQ